MARDDWDSLREDYMRDVRVQESAATVDQRRRALDEFEEWLEEDEDVTWDSLYIRDARRWITWLFEKGYDEWTVNEKFTGVKSCYGWLAENARRMDFEDPWPRIDMHEYRNRRADQPRIEEEMGGGIRRLSRDEFEKVLENVPVPETRNRLLFRLMINTGLRPGEIEGIRIDDVDFDERAIHVDEFKTSPARLVWYPRSLSSLMREWVYDRRNAYKSAHESDRLFVTRKKPQMNSNAVGYAAKRAFHEAGLITVEEFLDEDSDREPDYVWEDQRGFKRYQFSAHVFRHTFAMEFLESRGADAGSVYALKELLGHKDITTTADRYLRHVTDDTLKQAAKEYGPEF